MCSSYRTISCERPTSGTKLQEMADGLALPAVRSVKLTHQQVRTQRLIGSLKFIEKLQSRTRTRNSTRIPASHAHNAPSRIRIQRPHLLRRGERQRPSRCQQHIAWVPAAATSSSAPGERSGPGAWSGQGRGDGAVGACEAHFRRLAETARARRLSGCIHAHSMITAVLSCTVKRNC